jgi:hypothetical protein
MIFQYTELHVSALLIPSSDPCFYMTYAKKYAYCNVYPHFHGLSNIKYFKVLSPGVKRGRDVTLTTHPHLVPRLSMSRSYTSSSPCVSTACSGITLPLFFFKVYEKIYQVKIIIILKLILLLCCLQYVQYIYIYVYTHIHIYMAVFWFYLLLHVLDAKMCVFNVYLALLSVDFFLPVLTEMVR